MAVEVIMPQMGESIAEGTITRWLRQRGERVERDQPLLEISTDKVDAEVPSPASGTLVEVRFKEGDTVAVDTVIALIVREGEAAAAAPRPAPMASETVTSEPATSDQAPPQRLAPAAAPPAGPASRADQQTLEERVRVFSSPVVRRIAEQEGVDLRQVTGSGIHGRVTKKDVLAHLERARAEPAAPPRPAAVAAASPAAPGAFHVPAALPGERVRIEPMSRIRQLTASHMLYSQQTSAHVATVFDVDLSNVVAARAKARDAFAASAGTKLTFMPFFF